MMKSTKYYSYQAALQAMGINQCLECALVVSFNQNAKKKLPVFLMLVIDPEAISIRLYHDNYL